MDEVEIPHEASKGKVKFALKIDNGDDQIPSHVRNSRAKVQPTEEEYENLQ